MKKLQVTLLTAVVSLSCQNASAELFTAWDNLADGTKIETGSSLSGHFDLSSVIPTNGRYYAEGGTPSPCSAFHLGPGGQTITTSGPYMVPAYDCNYVVSGFRVPVTLIRSPGADPPVPLQN